MHNICILLASRVGIVVASVLFVDHSETRNELSSTIGPDI